MRSTATVFVLQAVAAFAFPGLLNERQACNADNCFRAVSNTQSLASRSADCSAFYEKTIYPCATTTTVTTTSSATVGTTTITVTTTVSPTSTVTSTSVSVSTATSITFAKRQANCPATSSAQLSVPTYASACSGTARYKSACSCLGITTASGTVTAATPTSTVTTSSVITVRSVTVTVTSTVSNVKTTTVGTVSVSVTTVVSTSSTSKSTSSSSSTTSTTSSSSSSSSTSSSTSSSASPTCSVYQFENTASGPYQYNYLQQDFTTGTIVLGPNSANLVVQSNGKLSQQGQLDQAASTLESVSGQDLNRLLFDSNPKPNNIICSTSGGVLNCAGPNGNPNGSFGATTFLVCPSYSSSQSYASGGGTVYLSDGINVPSGCTQLNLVAFPQC